MKRILYIVVIFAAYIVIFGTLWGDVKIIRTNPETPENLVHAQWKEPSRSEEVITGFNKKAVVSGKLELGSIGGDETDGSKVLDVYTDSRAESIKPLGFGTMDFKISAFRSDHLTGSDDNYSGSISVFSGLWNVGIHAIYSLSSSQILNETGTTIFRDDSKLTFGLSAGTSIVEEMPVNLSYTYSSIYNEENNSTADESIQNALSVRSSCSVGEIEIETQADFNRTDDSAKGMKTTKWGADLMIGYPTNEELRLKGYLNPDRTGISYLETGTDINSTILDYGIGLEALLFEEMNLSIDVGRIDTWSNSTTETNPIWKAEMGFQWSPVERVQLSTGYNLNKVVSGNLQQGFTLGAGYSGSENAILRSMNGNGGIDYIIDSSGDMVSIQSN